MSDAAGRGDGTGALVGEASAPALEGCDLTLSWDGGETVVGRHINIVVHAGELVCLVGKSGCGKSTLLHTLSGLNRPVEGEVLLHGRDVTGQTGHVSYMLQKDLLLPHLRIVDNVCLPLTLRGVSKEEAREQAAPLFGRFGLQGCELQWPSQLSGGMRQRAAFMRTYLMGNDVALLDEPFSALDALTRSDLREWYAGIAGELGIASLLITHDVDEAVALASRVYVLVGKPGTAEELPADRDLILQRLR